MKITSRYLAYELKKNLWRTVALTVISVIICVIAVSNDIDGTYDEHRQTGLYILPVILGIFSFIIAVLELSAFKNRRNLDALYSFPIDRRKMAAVHYLSGAIQIFTIYAVSATTHFLYLVANTDCFALGYAIPYYVLLFLIGIVLYSFFCFIFNQGNSVADGVIFSIMWSFVAYLVMYVFIQTFCKALMTPEIWSWEQYREFNDAADIAGWGNVIAPLNNLTVIFQDLIEVNRHNNEWYNYYDSAAYTYSTQAYMFFVWGAVGIASALGFVFGFGRKGAHKAGEPSDSWFGYRMLIPVYGYSLVQLMASRSNFNFLFALTIIAMYIGFVIYRRSFKIKRSDIITLACVIVPAVTGIILGGLMPSLPAG